MSSTGQKQDPAALVGPRAAALLGAALIAGLGLLTAGRWSGVLGGGDTIIQQPVTPQDYSRERPELSAPDPGDNP